MPKVLRNRLFQDYKSFVRAYIDDIIIFSKTPEKYLRYIAIVLEILDKVYIYISVLKSFAGYPIVRLLSYIVNGKRVVKTNNRITIFKKIKFLATLDILE
ncbi:hypothetical protein C8A01DRAFT_51274 [Parachaetomium inaequale]|uniref:Reverse transcriptase domain-containing protein n=1 Tax=Parachaetomium inaequale TaxID=2588326 RepID=A0AAN6SLI5_9PEZI|nr:hypothetical protein C8A01DRAFT_51274 [Parachaetomium inaequale]